MAQSVRIELVSEGFKELLQGKDVQAALKERANRIADRAGPGHEASVWVGFDRAHATVRTTTAKAARAEAQNRNLTRALGASGGL